MLILMKKHATQCNSVNPSPYEIVFLQVAAANILIYFEGNVKLPQLYILLTY